MSQPEHHYGDTELRNMAEGPNKRRGCCARHPVLCCSTLVFVLLLALTIGGVLGGLYSKVNHVVDNLIGEVNVYCSRH